MASHGIFTVVKTISVSICILQIRKLRLTSCLNQGSPEK